MKPTLDTLVDDIYSLFTEGHEDPSDELLDKMATDIAAIVKQRMLDAVHPRQGSLRMSNVGRPERQLWYGIHGLKGTDEPEPLRPQTHLLFLFGDIWEAVLLYLAEQSGHEVSHQQTEVELNGVLGHNDAVIDGVVVDVKSASPYGFGKFKFNSVEMDDTFGYMEQLAAYCKAFGEMDGAFLAVNKVNGELAVAKYPWPELEVYGIDERIDHLKEVVADSDNVPERCYSDVPEGKSGNMRLDTGCSYCAYKFHCWNDANDGFGLRSFKYANGIKHLTQVKKQPNVEEIS